MMAKNGKCSCNAGFLLVALVLLSVGAFALVAAFATQLRADPLSQATAMSVLPWYFVGFLVMFLGKMAKWKAHGACPVHKMG